MTDDPATDDPATDDPTTDDPTTDDRTTDDRTTDDPDPDTLLVAPEPWTGPSADPNDEQFGDVVATATLAEVDAYDVVLVGEPYDGAVIGRRGAREGPAAIRAELASLKTHRFGVGAVVGSDGPATVATVADVGDVAVEACHVDAGATTPTADSAVSSEVDSEVDSTTDHGATTTSAVQDRIATLARAVHDSAATPVILGGDNSLTVGNVLPLVEAAHETDELVGVVNFDAHLDVREPTDGPTSGTPYRQLLDAGLDRYVVAGARHFETSTTYASYVEDQGGAIVTADEVARDVDAARTRIASATADLDRVYVSVDLDVLDATAAPGVSAPTPGGLASRELFALVRSLASDERVAGFELVETAPSLDPASSPDSPARNRTVAAAARTVAHFIAGVSGRTAR